MLNVKSLIVMGVLTAAVAGGAALTLVERDPLPERGTLVFPGLLKQINDVARVEVLSAGARFELALDAGAWKAPDLHGYPLDGDKIHQLLVGAAGLERIEPKTGRPERYAELGLEDPSQQDAQSVGYTLKTGAGATLATLIVGERRPARGDPTGWEYYVRVPGDERGWLVQGSLPSGTKGAIDWLDPVIAKIDAERLKSVQVTHPDGEVVTVAKETPADTEFRYLELPAGAEVADAWRVNDIGKLLADLSLEGVKPGAEIAAFGEQALRVEVETFDGLRVSMQVGGSEDEHLARLRASFDAALVDEAGEREGTKLKSAEEVRQEAQRLNERWQDWVYQIPGFKAAYVAKKQSDLVEAKQEEEAKEGG